MLPTVREEPAARRHSAPCVSQAHKRGRSPGVPYGTATIFDDVPYRRVNNYYYCAVTGSHFPLVPPGTCFFLSK